MDKSVQSILTSLPEDKLPIVLFLRDIIITSKNISETVKWGRVTFCCNSKPIAFLCVHSKKKGVELGFFHKMDFTGLDLINNNSKRIQFTKTSDINNEQIIDLIKQANEKNHRVS